MFPVLPSFRNSKLEELVSQLLLEAGLLGKGLHNHTLQSIADYMLLINSYYTNAMEGNPSKLRDIDAALKKKFSRDLETRNYQLEHVAHIEVQKKMLKRLVVEPQLNICSKDFLCWLHKEFYFLLPKEMQSTQTISGKRISIAPGEIRDQGCQVGHHNPPQTKSEIENYLSQFENTLEPSRLMGINKIIAFASSHHRLLWIHPFADGNGRVARLFTDAYAKRIGICTENLWTVNRAFARKRKNYDQHLAAADLPRRNDFDGRGPLSEEELINFCIFFLECCLDQINYMNKMLKLDQMKVRFKKYLKIQVEEKLLSKGVAKILEFILQMGEIHRSQVQQICAVKERRSSQIIQEALHFGLAYSPSTYGPLRLQLNADLVQMLFPEIT